MSKIINGLNSRIASLRNFESLSSGSKLILLGQLRKIKLLTPDFANAKTAKSQGHGVLSAIMHLAPSDVSGFNVCPKASMGCRMACLNTAGRGRFQLTQLARIQKTLYFVKARAEFLRQLVTEIAALERRAARLGLKPVVRLNGTSDLQFELMPMISNFSLKWADNIFTAFPKVQFYDYTKILKRLERPLPSNYHLTFSASENNSTEVQWALHLGFNVAMVFDSIPTMWEGETVINGDAHDLRFLDPKSGTGFIVGLKAKGKAKQDMTGFVRIVSQPPVTAKQGE